MIQIKNTPVEQNLYLNLDGYSTTSTAGECTIRFECQLTGEVTSFERVTPVKTNGRYTQFRITPPSGTSTMTEGLYIVTVSTIDFVTEYARRLAFVSAIVAFDESTYTSYTEGDTDAYNVYTQ